jgi:hypothetical protein
LRGHLNDWITRGTGPGKHSEPAIWWQAERHPQGGMTIHWASMGRRINILALRTTVSACYIRGLFSATGRVSALLPGPYGASPLDQPVTNPIIGQQHQLEEQQWI